MQLHSAASLLPLLLLAFPNTILCTRYRLTYLFLRLQGPSHPVVQRGNCFVASLVYVQRKTLIARGKYLPVISQVLSKTFQSKPVEQHAAAATTESANKNSIGSKTKKAFFSNAWSVGRPALAAVSCGSLNR